MEMEENEEMETVKPVKNSSSLKKVIIIISVITLFVAMAITCPDKDMHKKVITDDIAQLYNQKMSSQNAFVKALGGMFDGIVKTMVDNAINNELKVDNYLIFSIGKFSYQGKSKTVTFGIFNHVFPMYGDKLNKALDGMNMNGIEGKDSI